MERANPIADGLDRNMDFESLEVELRSDLDVDLPSESPLELAKTLALGVGEQITDLGVDRHCELLARQSGCLAADLA
jgi:hypothetical protein